MTLHSANDNRSPSLNRVAPEHTGFQTDWVTGVIKSMDFYEAYLITKMRNKA